MYNYFQPNKNSPLPSQQPNLHQPQSASQPSNQPVSSSTSISSNSGYSNLNTPPPQSSQIKSPSFSFVANAPPPYSNTKSYPPPQTFAPPSNNQTNPSHHTPPLTFKPNTPSSPPTFQPSPVPPPSYQQLSTPPSTFQSIVPPTSQPSPAPPPTFQPSPAPPPTFQPSPAPPPTFQPSPAPPSYQQSSAPPSTFSPPKTSGNNYPTPSTFNPSAGVPISSAPPPLYSPSQFPSSQPTNNVSSPEDNKPPTPFPQQGVLSQSPSSNASQHFPSPVSLYESESLLHTYSGNSITSGIGDINNPPPPPAWSRYCVSSDEVSATSCSARYIRLSTYSIPISKELVNNSRLPFGAVITPLACPPTDEKPIPLVDYGSQPIPRCQRCRVYINPFSISNSSPDRRSYICPFCDFSNPAPEGFFPSMAAFTPGLPSSPLSHSTHSHPEFTCGSVEFSISSPDFINLPPKPLSLVFVIDVSFSSLQSGLCRTIVLSIQHSLNSLKASGSVFNVAFITYDNNIYFHRLDGPQPQLLVVPDINNIYLPVDPLSLFASLESISTIIDDLLPKIPSYFESSQEQHIAVGAALHAAAMTLEGRGGKIVCFQNSLASLSPGRLRNRWDHKAIGTDKEKHMYCPQENTDNQRDGGSYYNEMAKFCAERKCSVDMFLFSSTYCDVATLGLVTKITCGQLFYYPNFHSHPNEEQRKFTSDLKRILTRETGYDCVMKLRCSKGISINGYYGSFYSKFFELGEMDLSCVDSDKTFAVTFQHDERLQDKKNIYLQAALLYTTSSGQRRLRIHTLSAQTTAVLSNVYRSIDVDATINLMMRDAISETTKLHMSQIRTNIHKRTTALIFGYRKYCTSNNSNNSNVSLQQSSSQKLLLPESCTLLPLYTLALLKNILFRPGADVKLDERSSYFLYVDSLPLDRQSTFLYPRMIPLIKEGNPQSGIQLEDGHFQLPPSMRLSLSLSPLEEKGIYVFENSQTLSVWVGQSVDPKILSQLFGVSSISELNPQTHRLLPSCPQNITDILNAILNRYQNCMRIQIVKQGDPTEKYFQRLIMVEDPQGELISYGDFLIFIHREISKNINESQYK